MTPEEAEAFIRQNLADQVRHGQAEIRSLAERLETAEREVELRKIDRLKVRMYEQLMVALGWEETLDGMRDKLALFRAGQYEKCFSKDAEIQNVIAEYREIAP